MEFTEETEVPDTDTGTEKAQVGERVFFYDDRYLREGIVTNVQFDHRFNANQYAVKMDYTGNVYHLQECELYNTTGNLISEL